MLEISNLEVVYNEVILVLRGLSLVVPDGKIVALLGANGAGKTTTLRAITGLLDIHYGEITKGTITFDGQRLDAKAAAAIVRSGVTQVMEGRRMFADLTVDENLVVRRLHQPRPRRGERRPRAGVRPLPEAVRTAQPGRRATCRAASSRCWPSAGR